MAWYSPETTDSERFDCMRLCDDAVRPVMQAILRDLEASEKFNSRCMNQASEAEKKTRIFKTLYHEALAIRALPPGGTCSKEFVMTHEEKIRYRTEIAEAYDIASRGDRELVFAIQRSDEEDESEILKGMTIEARMNHIDISSASSLMLQAVGMLHLVEQWCKRDRERSESRGGLEATEGARKPEETEAFAATAILTHGVPEYGRHADSLREESANAMRADDQGGVDNRDLPI